MKLGDYARLYQKAIYSHVDEPEFNLFDVSRVLYQIKTLREHGDIDDLFAHEILLAFYAKWDAIEVNIDEG